MLGFAQTFSGAPASLSFPPTAVGTSSAPLNTVLTGTYLTPSSGTITVAASAHFNVCATATGAFVNSYTISYTGGALSATSIYVKFNPSTAGLITGNLSITGGGAATLLIPLDDTGLSVYRVSGGGVYCGGFVPDITLSHSDLFTDYQLYNGSSTVGSAVSGSGGMINFGAQTASGVYHVIATSYFGSSLVMADSAVVTTGTLSSVPIVCPFALTVGDTAPVSTSLSSPVWGISPASFASISSSGVVTGISPGISNVFYVAGTACHYARLPIIPAGNFVADSFYVGLVNNCTGPMIQVVTNSPSASLHLKTFYGDGTSDYRAVGSSTAYHLDSFSHVYTASGAYSIKHVLFYGSTPMDSITYSYNYTLCHSLSLSLFYDGNHDCAFGASTDFMNGIPVNIEIDSNGVVIDTIPVTSGLNYSSYDTGSSVYRFRVLSPYVYPLCPSSGLIYDTLTGGGFTSSNLSIPLTSPASTGFDLRENISVRTGRHQISGCLVISNPTSTNSSAIVTLHYDPRYSFTWANPSPVSATDSTLFWYFSSVSVSAAPLYINYTLDVAGGSGSWLAIGDSVRTSVSVVPTSGDVDTTNNIITRLDTVMSSYDPNYTAVSPDGNILNGTKLHYTVHFENDGNDTARNIYVMDTLSDYLNPSTLRLVAASATMNIAVLHASGHTILKFDFPNIKLPDSSHHGLCSGFVMYDIDALRGLSDGTPILGHAGIYFDDNPVVLTDTSFNQILVPHLSIVSSGMDSICSGDTVNLRATPATVGMTHYQWYVNSTAMGTDSVGFILPPSIAGDTVKCKMTTIMDDTAYSTSNVLILANRGLPTAGTISGLSNVCPGAGITLSETIGGGTWGISNSHASVSGGYVTGISGGADTALYTVTNLCGTSTASYAVMVNPLSSAGIISGASIVCIGSSSTMSSTATGGSWSLTNSHASHSGALITGVTAGADTVIYTVTNICDSAVAYFPLTVNTTITPSITITATPTGSLCSGDTVNFVAIPVNGGTAPALSWLISGTATAATGSTFSYPPAMGDVVTCNLASSIACPTAPVVSSAGITMTVIPSVTPTLSIVSSVDSITSVGQTVTFYGTPSYGGTTTSYQWFLNGAPVAGATTLTFTLNVYENDTVYCLMTGNPPCATSLTATSNTKIVYANYLSVNDLHTTIGNLSLFPNPNNGGFTLSGDVQTNGTISYDVFDVTGRMICSGTTLPTKGKIEQRIDLDKNIPSGIYLLKLYAGNQREVMRFSVVK